MLKRMLLMLAVVLAILGGLGFFKYKQFEGFKAMGASFAPPPTAVTTLVAKQEKWPSTLNVIGTATAIQGVTVSADLPGTVDNINFRVRPGRCRQEISWSNSIPVRNALNWPPRKPSAIWHASTSAACSNW